MKQVVSDFQILETIYNVLHQGSFRGSKLSTSALLVSLNLCKKKKQDAILIHSFIQVILTT